MTLHENGPVISVMLAVPDASKATIWYQRALGAKELWSLGSVVGLELGGAPFFIGEPERNGWESPTILRTTTCRVELFSDDPEAVVTSALECGATGSPRIDEHEMPWGVHRQGGFVDPYGHIWFVGDRSPLRRFETA